MKRMIIKSPARPIKQANTWSSLYNKQIAVTYGTIDSNNDNGTTNVLLVTGFLAVNIKILSTFYPSKDPTIGGIVYPPVGSEVMILHPIGDLDSGWIIPAPLDEKDDQVVSDLLSGGDKSILPGGWTKIYDQETGDISFINDASGVIEFNGSIPVARKDDSTEINATTDLAWYTWLAAVGTGSGAGPPPSTITGKITTGSDKIKVG